MQHAMSAFTRVRVSAGQWRDDPRRRDVLVDGVRAFLAVSLRKLLIVFLCSQKAAPRGPSRGLARSVSVGGLTKFAAGPVERGRAVFKHTRSGRSRCSEQQCYCGGTHNWAHRITFPAFVCPSRRLKGTCARGRNIYSQRGTLLTVSVRSGHHVSGTVRKAQKVRLMMLMSSCISVPDRMHSRSHGMSSRADRSEMSKSRFISL